MRNIYFELTREFNAEGPIAVLSSGQAVVYYRIAIMSKDGDWILRETPEACDRVLEVLAKKEADYRSGAPLDVRWLAGGWSSHFEFADELGRRIRCDFFTRPPRVSRNLSDEFFSTGEPGELLVVDVDSLIQMKKTQRAKDYPALAELARLLPPEKEVELTTDPDRILALASQFGATSRRKSVQAAREGKGRREVVITLAQEIDRLQQLDRKRLARYQEASRAYLVEFHKAELSQLPLLEAHRRCCDLALKHLPREVRAPEEENGDA